MTLDDAAPSNYGKYYHGLFGIWWIACFWHRNYSLSCLLTGQRSDYKVAFKSYQLMAQMIYSSSKNGTKKLMNAVILVHLCLLIRLILLMANRYDFIVNLGWNLLTVLHAFNTTNKLDTVFSKLEIDQLNPASCGSSQQFYSSNYQNL